MEDRDFVSIFYFVISLFFLSGGIPLYLRKVPPNRWLGYRTRKTLNNVPLWYEANSILGRYMMMGGLILTAVTGALFLRRYEITLELQAWSNMAAVMIIMLFAGVRTAIYIRTKEKRVTSHKS